MKKIAKFENQNKISIDLLFIDEGDVIAPYNIRKWKPFLLDKEHVKIIKKVCS